MTRFPDDALQLIEDHSRASGDGDGRSFDPAIYSAAETLVAHLQNVGRAAVPSTMFARITKTVAEIEANAFERRLPPIVCDLLRTVSDRQYPGYVAANLILLNGITPTEIAARAIDMAGDLLVAARVAELRSNVTGGVRLNSQQGGELLSDRLCRPPESVLLRRCHSLEDVAQSLRSCRSAWACSSTHKPVDAEMRISWSLLPLSRSHDESVFIRSFQVFENLFLATTSTLEELGKSSDCSNASRMAIIEQLRAVAASFRSCQLLWDVLRSITWDGFILFGQHSRQISATLSPTFRKMHEAFRMLSTNSGNYSALGPVVAEELATLARDYADWYASHQQVVAALIEERHPEAGRMLTYLRKSKFCVLGGRDLRIGAARRSE